MEKKNFETPELQVTEFAVADVVPTSGGSGCEFDAGSF